MNKNVTNDDFRFYQYDALRAEILGIKDRLIKMQIIGITSIPLVIGAGQQFKITTILAAAPLITLVFALMVIFEQNSLMRAGAYIKQKIEPNIKPENFIGWEQWLEETKKGRDAEKFFAWSVHLVFAIYFLIGLYLAYGAVLELTKGHHIVSTIITSIYAGGFLIALYVVITHLPTGTTTFDLPESQRSTTRS